MDTTSFGYDLVRVTFQEDQVIMSSTKLEVILRRMKRSRGSLRVWLTKDHVEPVREYESPTANFLRIHITT